MLCELLNGQQEQAVSVNLCIVQVSPWEQEKERCSGNIFGVNKVLSVLHSNCCPSILNKAHFYLRRKCDVKSQELISINVFLEVSQTRCVTDH